MSWILHHKLRNHVRDSIWMLPVFGIAAALVSVISLHWIEERSDWRSEVAPSASLAVLSTLAGAMLTFIVFLSSTLLLVMQLASAQLSPRVIGVVFRHRVPRIALTLFTFTFAFTLAVIVRIEDSTPAVTAYLAAYLCLLCVGVFLYLIDHVARTLRPSGALRAVGSQGRAVIEHVYPRPLTRQSETSPLEINALGSEPASTVLNPKDGVLLAFDPHGLVALARVADCLVELVPQVGDFVAAGSPLFRIFGGKGSPPARALCQSVALGHERTMEQDSAFAFRIIVDIAAKGLSPAINDPTTAVLAIDQIHHLLRNVGGRHLDDGVAYDEAGRKRLIYPTPDWEDFVELAVTEIRHFGGTSIQVARRLHAMLENLLEVLPQERTTLLRRELVLLHRSASRFFPEQEDQAMAEVSDLQGVGGGHFGQVPGIPKI